MKNTTKLIATTALALSFAQINATAQNSTTPITPTDVTNTLVVILGGTTNSGTTTTATTTGNSANVSNGKQTGGGTFGTGTFANTRTVRFNATGQQLNTSADVGANVIITARVIVQNTNSVTNAVSGAVTTRPAIRRLLTTADVLRVLGNDAAMTGRITGTNFAVGSRLVFTNNTFVVFSGADTIDVGDIITFETGTNQIFAGTTDTNGLARPVRTIIEIGRITFNDTAINTTNGLVFYLQGQTTETTIDTAASTSTGNFREARTLVLTQGTGEGAENVGSGDDRAIIVAGNVTTRGSAIGTDDNATGTTALATTSP